MGTVRLKRVSLLLLSFLFAASQLNPQAPKPAEAAIEAAKLLNESYGLAANFDLNERVPYLVRLTNVAVGVAPAATAKEWCLELFRLSPKLQDAQTRIADEKNALVALSKIDAQGAQLAVDLFPKVDDPPPGNLSEDVRADAAIHIFPNYWRITRRKGLPQIESVARHIGDTGEYPYEAVGLILAELAKIKNDDEGVLSDANIILSDAVRYYQRKASRFRNKNIEFFDFLEKAKPFSSEVQYRDGVDVFVNHLITETPPKENFLEEIHTSKGVFKFENLNEGMLFRAFKLISEILPQRAHELAQKHPELDQAGEDIEYFSSGVVLGNPSPAEANRLQNQMSQEALLSRIQSLQQTNPTAALQLVGTLASPTMRAIGFSSVVQGMTQSDSAKARSIYVKQFEVVSNLKEDADKLNALVSLAKAAYFMRDTNNFDLLTIEILDKGEKIFAEDVKKGRELRPDFPWRADVHAGYNQLADIVEFDAAHGSAWLSARVSQMQNETLKPYLLIYAARGTYEAGDSSPVAHNRAVAVGGVK